MRAFPNGEWTINSIIVNQETVMNDDGFRSIVVTDDAFIVRPMEMTLRVTLCTSETAVLESQGQVFYANYWYDGRALLIEMTRLNFKETIQIEAVLAKAETSSSARVMAEAN